MTENFFYSRIKSILDSNQNAIDVRNYKIITVRPGDEAAALIDVMTEINDNRIPLTRISDLISEELFNFVSKRKDTAEIVLDVLDETISWDEHSAFGLLQKNRLIERIKHKFNIEWTDKTTAQERK